MPVKETAPKALLARVAPARKRRVRSSLPVYPTSTESKAGRQGRPSRAEQIRRQDLLLDVALEEFIAEGFSGASIETIASKAGVGKSTIYRNFTTKQGLLLAVASRRVFELGARWSELNFDINDPEGTLYQIALMSYREWSGKSLPIYRIIYTEATRLPDLARQVHDLTLHDAIWPVTDYFQKLQDIGFIQVKDVTEATSMFLTIAVGGARLLIIPSELDDDAKHHLAREAVQSFLYGYAALRPTGRSL